MAPVTGCGTQTLTAAARAAPERPWANRRGRAVCGGRGADPRDVGGGSFERGCGFLLFWICFDDSGCRARVRIAGNTETEYGRSLQGQKPEGISFSVLSDLLQKIKLTLAGRTERWYNRHNDRPV